MWSTSRTRVRPFRISSRPSGRRSRPSLRPARGRTDGAWSCPSRPIHVAGSESAANAPVDQREVPRLEARLLAAQVGDLPRNLAGSREASRRNAGDALPANLGRIPALAPRAIVVELVDAWCCG